MLHCSNDGHPRATHDRPRPAFSGHHSPWPRQFASCFASNRLISLRPKVQIYRYSVEGGHRRLQVIHSMQLRRPLELSTVNSCSDKPDPIYSSFGLKFLSITEGDRDFPSVFRRFFPFGHVDAGLQCAKCLPPGLTSSQAIPARPAGATGPVFHGFLRRSDQCASEQNSRLPCRYRHLHRNHKPGGGTGMAVESGGKRGHT